MRLLNSSLRSHFLEIYADSYLYPFWHRHREPWGDFLHIWEHPPLSLKHDLEQSPPSSDKYSQSSLPSQTLDQGRHCLVEWQKNASHSEAVKVIFVSSKRFFY